MHDDVTQRGLDQQNAVFWNEPCGTQLARSIGIDHVTPESLRRFDEAYFHVYPYLTKYVADEPLANKEVLEIGLGFGTLGQLLAECGAVYHGLDVAEEPVGLMRLRLGLLDRRIDAQTRIVQGSALAIPFEDDSFDYAYSIGCLHHTGDISRGVAEIARVLRPGGKTIVMLYNSRSFRQFSTVQWKRLLSRSKGKVDEQVRRLYDANEAGDAPPHTDYVSKREVRRIFSRFTRVDVRARNFDSYALLRGRISVRREWFLGNIDRLLGLDLYVVAEK
jgi:SAM-dependent methyltransferase